MQFLYPNFLWALLALAIPIIIHLFYFRRFKKVYFTNVRFLKEVKEETSARRKLRNLLVLLARCLAIAFLVFAFAQPFIPQSENVKKGIKTVSVFVDNSQSMNALSQDVSLLDKAKQRAREIVDAFSPDDRFQIITHDLEGRHQFLVSKEDAITLISEIEITPAVRKLSRVLARQKQAFESNGGENQLAFMISDFQRNITDLENLKDSLLELSLVPLQAVQESNISIDSAWFISPVQMLNQTNLLIVKLTNYGNQDAENIRLALRQEGQNKPVGTLTIPAGESVYDTANISILKPGWQEAQLTITDYPIQFDDTYYFSFYVAEKINILSINPLQPNRYLSAALKGIPYFNLVNQSSQKLDYSAFPGFQLIILNDLGQISSGLAFELSQYVENGGNLLVFPGVNADLPSYRSFLTTLQANELVQLVKQEKGVASINTDAFVFKDVFEETNQNLKLPVTQANYKFTGFNTRPEETLLVYRDGSTFLGKYTAEEGNVFLCAAPLDQEYNNLVGNAEIFVPMLYKMAISNSKDRKIAHFIGKDEVIETDPSKVGAEAIFRLKGANKEFIPEKRSFEKKTFLKLNNQITEAGYYDLLVNQDETVFKYAFNFDRRESSLNYFSPSDLQTKVGEQVVVLDLNNNANLTAVVGEKSRGVQLWKWCLILALAFLLVEGVLLRFWKTV